MKGRENKWEKLILLAFEREKVLEFLWFEFVSERAWKEGLSATIRQKLPLKWFILW